MVFHEHCFCASIAWNQTRVCMSNFTRGRNTAVSLNCLHSTYSVLKFSREHDSLTSDRICCHKMLILRTWVEGKLATVFTHAVMTCEDFVAHFILVTRGTPPPTLCLAAWTGRPSTNWRGTLSTNSWLRTSTRCVTVCGTPPEASPSATAWSAWIPRKCDVFSVPPNPLSDWPFHPCVSALTALSSMSWRGTATTSLLLKRWTRTVTACGTRRVA